MTVPAPVSLGMGEVQLEPLSEAHTDALAQASADGDIGALTYTSAPQATAASALA